MPSSGTASEQLAELKTRLEKEKKEAQEKTQQVDQLKLSITDLGQRITGLQKVVDAGKARSKEYDDFYNTTQVTKRETDCAIPTIRCQLELTDGERACVEKAIGQVDTRIQGDRDALKKEKDLVAGLEREYGDAVRALNSARAINEFFSTLVAETRKKLADLDKLRAGADPTKDRCIAWFYLGEMETLLASNYDGTAGAACYPPSTLTIGTFLDCWSPDCYAKAADKAVVTFNTAEYLEKCLKGQLETAKKRLADAEKVVAEATAEKRRQWIIEAIAAAECCRKPASV